MKTAHKSLRCERANAPRYVWRLTWRFARKFGSNLRGSNCTPWVSTLHANWRRTMLQIWFESKRAILSAASGTFCTSRTDAHGAHTSSAGDARANAQTERAWSAAAQAAARLQIRSSDLAVTAATLRARAWTCPAQARARDSSPSSPHAAGALRGTQRASPRLLARSCARLVRGPGHRVFARRVLFIIESRACSLSLVPLLFVCIMQLFMQSSTTHNRRRTDQTTASLAIALQ